VTRDFVSLLTEDPAHNQALWQRHPHNPVIATGEPWCRDFLAPSTLIAVASGIVLYAEGSTGGVEQAGAFVSPASSSLTVWQPVANNPLVAVGDGFDAGGVFDPSVAVVGARYFLYYSATTGDAHEFAHALGGNAGAAYDPTTESIGLAVGDSPIAFAKHGRVLQGRCPHVVVHGGMVHLFFVRVHASGYLIHLARSDDGFTFTEEPEPVLVPGGAGAWDACTVTTPQIVSDGGRFVMLFAGDATSLDDPRGIGVAVSDDLVRWEKNPGNPVFVPGPRGTFDAVSVACPIMRHRDGTYRLLYAGSDRTVAAGLHSQVGLATLRPDEET
jgi:predicted GH43/DUF377 family glycosyl hydrolase